MYNSCIVVPWLAVLWFVSATNDLTQPRLSRSKSRQLPNVLQEMSLSKHQNGQEKLQKPSIPRIKLKC